MIVSNNNDDVLNQAVIADKNSDQNKRKRQNLTQSTIYEKTWITFPFQLFQTNAFPFVFENGVFHSHECASKSYSYTQNSLSANQNVSCVNLQYNQKLANLLKFQSVQKPRN